MLTTKERDPEDVEAPASGHSTMFVDVNTGEVKSKRSNGDVLGGSSAPSWSTLIATAGTHELVAGERRITKFSNRVDGITLQMPYPAANGDVVNAKEAIGWANDDDVFDVFFNVYTAGEGEDQHALESPLGLVDTACVVNDSGVALRWVFDAADLVWRLQTYLRPSGPA